MALLARFLMVRLVRIGSPTRPSVPLCRRARGRQGRRAPLKRWPEDGPSVTAAARDGTHCAQVGAEGWCRSNKRMGGLPSCARIERKKVWDRKKKGLCRVLALDIQVPIQADPPGRRSALPGRARSGHLAPFRGIKNIARK